MSGKRLYRSLDDRMIAGVCGGLGEYFNIDPTVIRLLLAFLTILGGGTGILVYLIAWIVIPEETVASTPEDLDESTKQLQTAVETETVEQDEELAETDVNTEA